MARGPNKLKSEVQKLAQSYGPDAIDRLAEIMNDSDQPGMTQVAAAKELLDRGFGKSTQIIAGDEDGSPVKFETQIDWDKLPLETLKQLMGAASRSPLDEEE